MTLNIYMKSGNRIRLRGVKTWKVHSKGNEITGLEIERRWMLWFVRIERLVVSSIDLSQIEAVTVT